MTYILFLRVTVQVVKSLGGIDLVSQVLRIKDERCIDVHCHNDLKDDDVILKERSELLVLIVREVKESREWSSLEFQF